MGFWSTVGKIAKVAAPVVAAPFTGGASLAALPGVIGAGLGEISQSTAHNRGEKFGGQLDLERALIEREFMNNQSRKSAWSGLKSAQHTINPGARPQLSPYSVAPRQSTGAELQGADALTQEVMARLQGGPGRTNVDTSLLDPGIWERITGYGSAGLSGLNALRQSQQPPSVNSVVDRLMMIAK